MKTKEQIEKFLNQKSYCSLCHVFRESLAKAYAISLNSANDFIDQYKYFMCGNVETFIHGNKDNPDNYDKTITKLTRIHE